MAFEFSGKPKPQLCRKSVVLCSAVQGPRSTEQGNGCSIGGAGVGAHDRRHLLSRGVHGPLGVPVPHLQDVAHVLAPGTERLVSYHLVTDGKAVVCFPGEEDIPVTAGDILIIPHGDAHTVSNGSPSTFLDSGASLGNFLAGDLTTMRLGGGGETDQIRLRLFRLRTSCRSALPCRPAADDQDQPARRPGRRMAGELGSPSGLPGWIRATGTVGPALQDGGSALHRNHSPLHGGVAAGADRLACRCAGSGRRRRAGASAPEALSSLDRGANLPPRPAFRARSLPRGSPGFSASRH